jgi:hypothetical protein
MHAIMSGAAQEVSIRFLGLCRLSLHPRSLMHARAWRRIVTRHRVADEDGMVLGTCCCVEHLRRWLFQSTLLQESCCEHVELGVEPLCPPHSALCRLQLHATHPCPAQDKRQTHAVLS